MLQEEILISLLKKNIGIVIFENLVHLSIKIITLKPRLLFLKYS